MVPSQSPKKLTVVEPMSTNFRTMLNYTPWCLGDRSQNYEDEVAKRIDKMTKRLKASPSSQLFNRPDTTTILSFLQAFQMAFDINGIHQGMAMWLFNLFIKKQASPAFS